MGYRLTGMHWGLVEFLARMHTSFQAEHVGVRLDLLLADVLLWPDDPPDARWAQQYGYASPNALYRAFGSRYGVSVGDVRRVGRLAAWLANASWVAALDRRQAEGDHRVAALASHLRERGLGTYGEAALVALVQGRVTSKAPRRYPAPSRWERALIARRWHEEAAA